MSARELVILGTASQVPTRTRAHNALFLFWDELGILFDPGEGTQRQMLLAGIAANRITHIAITHFHGDHCLGLAGVIQRLSMDRVEHPVEIFYPRSGQEYFERLWHASIFHDVVTIEPRPIPPASDKDRSSEAEITIGEYGDERFLARRLDHAVDCYGYRLQEKPGRHMRPELLVRAGVRGAAVGELMRTGEIVVGGRRVYLDEVSAVRPGQAFALVMDTRPCAAALELARGTDLLVCESTFLSSEEAEAREYGHMTAAQAAGLGRAAHCRQTVLTHFSRRYESLQPFEDEAAAIDPNVIVARDLRRVPVPKRSA